MPIVDFHIHPQRSDQLAKEARAWQDRFYEGRSYFYDDVLVSPERFLEFLKGEGVDYAVLLAELSPITGSNCPNEYIAEFAKGIDNFIPFVNINPYITPRPARALENFVVNYGFRGLKLYPTYQYFYANDRMIYPLYQKALELGIPVMIHTGSSIFPGSRIKYGDPIYIDDVAVDFPDLTIIEVHGGRGFWYDKAFFLAQLHKNVYMDIAGLPPKRLLNYFPELEKNQDKVLFGSDWPGLPSISDNIRAIRELPISDECKEKILGGNAMRLLRL